MIADDFLGGVLKFSGASNLLAAVVNSARRRQSLFEAFGQSWRVKPRLFRKSLS